MRGANYKLNLLFVVLKILKIIFGYITKTQLFLIHIEIYS